VFADALVYPYLVSVVSLVGTIVLLIVILLLLIVLGLGALTRSRRRLLGT